MNFIDNLAQKIQRLLKLQGMKAESAGFDDEFGYAFCNILLKEACENDFKLDYCDVDKIWQKVLRYNGPRKQDKKLNKIRWLRNESDKTTSHA